jgi:hypothetical protein
MSIEAKIEGLIAALEKQTAAIQYSALIMASLIEGNGASGQASKKTRTKKEEPVVETAAVRDAIVEHGTAVLTSDGACPAPVVVSVEAREVTAEQLRAEVIKLVGGLKGKLDERKYSEFTTRLKGEVYPSFKTVNGPVKTLDDTNVMDDTERGDFLTATEKLVAEYV